MSLLWAIARFISKRISWQRNCGKSDAEGILENAFWQIALNEDGSLQLVDKDSGVRYDRVLQIEESSDDGDEYDYSPAKEEWVITAANAKPQCDIIHEARRAGLLSAMTWQCRSICQNAAPGNPLAE